LTSSGSISLIMFIVILYLYKKSIDAVYTRILLAYFE